MKSWIQVTQLLYLNSVCGLHINYAGMSRKICTCNFWAINLSSNTTASKISFRKTFKFFFYFLINLNVLIKSGKICSIKREAIVSERTSRNANNTQKNCERQCKYFLCKNSCLMTAIKNSSVSFETKLNIVI